MGVEELIGSGLLLGTYTPKLDEKGRLLLPAKLRPRFARGLVMTKGQERCIFLLPVDEFARFYERLKDAPVTEKGVRDYLRVLLASASEETPDRQGRVSIPQSLRDYAGLDRDVAVIGAGTRVEVWDKGAWDTYLAEKEAAYADTATQLLPDLAF